MLTRAARLYPPSRHWGARPSRDPRSDLVTRAAPALPLLGALSEGQQEMAREYIRTVLETNESVNLTAVKDFDDAMVKHVEDSLSLLPVLDRCSPAGPDGPASLLDVGSGAGLPAFVIAIARPQWSIVAMDTLRKRCDFMTATADKLGLQVSRVGEW